MLETASPRKRASDRLSSILIDHREEVSMNRNTLASLFAVAIFVFGLPGSFQLYAQHHVSAAALSPADPLSSATVAFGGWKANPHLCPPVGTNPPAPCPAVDRFAPNAGTQFPRFSNQHTLAPQVAKIRSGGSVNFIIGGLHVVAVYDDGTQPQDIDQTLLVPNRPPMTPPIMNDARNRIYRGLDPFLLPINAQQDRVEVVQFDEPGLYLVICAVLPHFREGMYGYVRVLRKDEELAQRIK